MNRIELQTHRVHASLARLVYHRVLYHRTPIGDPDKLPRGAAYLRSVRQLRQAMARLDAERRRPRKYREHRRGGRRIVPVLASEPAARVR
ncbi:MAG TPA: hypothetical protein VH575_25250 [Gemmataceae bacterium]|jgi:hypothetical protein